MFYRCAIILIFFLLSFEMNAQYRSFISAPYEWQNEFKIPALDSLFAEESAVTLLEINRMAVHGQKSQFMNIYFEQKGMIQFKNQEGINSHSAFLLPKALDPFYEGQFMPITEKIYQPFFNVRMLFFAGRVKKPNGKIEPAIFRYAFPHNRRIIDKQFEPVFLYFVQVTNLGPGDVLEYHYKYEVPYDVNWMHFNSTRIFHESDIAKQNYQLQLEIPRKLRSSFEGDSPEKTWEEGNTIIRLWKKNGLHALLKENGSRIFKDFEHIVYKLNENNLSYAYRHPRTGELLPTRFYNHIARTRQKRDFWYRRVARRRMVLDKQGRMFRTWIDRETNENQSPFEKLNTLNADIAQNFNYHDDTPYYSLQDFGLEKMGDYTLAKRIRDISRHNIYTKIFNRLDFKEYKVLYVLDKRVGEISEDFPSNLYFNERIFFSNDTSAAFVFPKRMRMGYEVNELPFYLEGVKAFGYALDELFDDGITAFKTDSIPVFTKENIRETQLDVNVDLENGSINAKGNVKLFGQFSTLTRGVYLFNEIDSTINPNYGKRIFDMTGEVKLRRVKQSLFEPSKNLFSKFDLEFSKQKSFYENSDTTCISLHGILNFVTWDEMNFENRQSTFYPDFGFTDEFEIELLFKKKVDLMNSRHHSEKNEYGEFEYELSQADSNSITIRTFWSLIPDSIPANKIMLLKSFYDLIDQANEEHVCIKILD